MIDVNGSTRLSYSVVDECAINDIYNTLLYRCECNCTARRYGAVRVTGRR